ncbi:MAG: class I SAM-dependent methyltransferase [Roseovarius sp.]
MTDHKTYTSANKAAWDASAAAHEAGPGWQALWQDVAQPGFSVLDATMTATLQALEITGARVVQVGCNNGRELLSMPSLGAVPVLGIDQSQAFLDQARRLAARAGSECRFECADIYDLPDDLPHDFDLAIITIGVLNWMPDLPRMLGEVAALLAPGGRLVIYETHPVLEMVEPGADDPHALTYSYFRKDPFVEEQAITYDGSDAGAAPASYWFIHTLGAIVTGCVQAGLVIETLTEYPHSNREVDYDIYQGQDAQLPMCFTLVAKKLE